MIKNNISDINSDIESDDSGEIIIKNNIISLNTSDLNTPEYSYTNSLKMSSSNNTPLPITPCNTPNLNPNEHNNQIIEPENNILDNKLFDFEFELKQLNQKLKNVNNENVVLINKIKNIENSINNDNKDIKIIKLLSFFSFTVLSSYFLLNNYKN